MPKTKRQTTAMTTAMQPTPDVGANVIVDMDELEAADYLLPDTPSKEPAPKKGRCNDNSDELNSAMALAIISSLKSVINDRADILDKGIEGLKTSVEFLTEEMKDIKCKAERTDKRVDAAENRINDLESKVMELARYKRRWNLRLYGLPELQGENIRQRVLDVCTSVIPAYADKVSDLTDWKNKEQQYSRRYSETTRCHHPIYNAPLSRCSLESCKELRLLGRQPSTLRRGPLT